MAARHSDKSKRQPQPLTSHAAGAGGHGHHQSHQIPIPVTKKTFVTRSIGNATVYLGGNFTEAPGPSTPVFVTVHDIGETAQSFDPFLQTSLMQAALERSMWIHFEVPGQCAGAPRLPDNYQFPDCDRLAEAIYECLEELKVKLCIGIGVGVGGNILIRMALVHPATLLGIIAIHPTTTAAGMLQQMRDKQISAKLNAKGRVSGGVEEYLVKYKFGSHKDDAKLRVAIEAYSRSLKSIDPANLEKFFTVYSARSDLHAMVKSRFDAEMLVMIGADSDDVESVTSFAKVCQAASKKAQFVKMTDVADALSENPDAVAKAVVFFAKGCGVLTSMPLNNSQGMEVRLSATRLSQLMNEKKPGPYY